MLHPETLAFLEQLALHNTTDRFHAHREWYDEVRTSFLAWLQECLDQLSLNDTEISWIQAKDVVFRINRDTRFSKNKSPYKRNFWAYFNKQGKSWLYASYYIHIEPWNHTLIWGWIHRPESNSMEYIRRGIIEHPWQRTKGISSIEWKKWFSVLQWRSLKTHPRGFHEYKNHEHIKHIRMKDRFIKKEYTDKDVLQDAFTEIIVWDLWTLTPFIHLLNSYLPGESPT